MASSTISLCQSSIHSFLTNIPSEASELAVNAVNTYIEDQVTDPEKIAKNISRVRSVFSRKRPGENGGGDGGGDCPNLERKFLLTLPRKIRQKIWHHLDNETVKTLRFVCQQLKHEMDYEVGLSITLRPETFNSLWMRSISVRTCNVKRMDSLFTLNLMTKPEKLEKLSFDPELFVDADIAELIIRKFRNLRQLIIYTDDVAELKNELDEATSNGLSSNIIARLDDQFELTSVDVKFDTTKWKLKWNIKLKPQVFSKYWQIQDVIGPFGSSGVMHVPSRDLSKKSLKSVTLSIPFVQEYDRLIWLKVLGSQNVLRSLTCDLNATHWKEYEIIIRANHKTLKNLFLLNITSTFTSNNNNVASSCVIDMALEKRHTEMPFDWLIFEDCIVLEEITLIADTFMRQTAASKSRRYIDNINLSSLKSPVRALWLENFKFTAEQVKFLKEGEPGGSIKQRFELCTLKNCKLGDEEVAEAQVGMKKGRNRSMECLCFGTVSYDDDDLQNYQKYVTNDLISSDDEYEDVDAIDWFQLANGNAIEERKGVGSMIVENLNIVGGIALTAWLALC